MLPTSDTSTFAKLIFILDSWSNQHSPTEHQPQAALQHGSPLPRGYVPLFSEININPFLQCFCNFTKKNLFYYWQWKSMRATPGISIQLHLWNKGSGRSCWVVQTAKMSLGWLTSCLWPHSFLLPFQARKIFRSVCERYPSCGLPEITNQHCNRKQLREAEGFFWKLQCYSPVLKSKLVLGPT